MGGCPGVFGGGAGQRFDRRPGAATTGLPWADNAPLFDGGENGGGLTAAHARRPRSRVASPTTTSITSINSGLDRIVRANTDRDKVLRVFGPVNTIRKVYDRITAYEYPFFPFQKIVVEVTELLLQGDADGGSGVYQEVPRSRWSPGGRGPGRCSYENAGLRVAPRPPTTVPCLAFALAEKTGYHPDPAKLGAGALRPGAWVPEALRLLRAGADADTRLEIDGGSFTLAALRRPVLRPVPRGRGWRTLPIPSFPTRPARD